MKTDERLLNNIQRYRKTKKGVLTNIYHHQKSRNVVEYSLKEFQDKFINDKSFERLYNEWVKHNYNIQYKPTIDRIDCFGTYNFKNIHWLSWADNRYKQRMELKKIRAKKVLMLKDGEIVKEFNSQREAVIKTKLSQGNLSSCLNGRRKYCGGYEWKYKEEVIENIYENEVD